MTSPLASRRPLTALALAGALTFAFFATLPVSSQAADTASTNKICVLPIQGPIDKSMLFIFRRAFSEFEQARPAAVVLDIDTPGGGLAQTEEIISWIRARNVPVYAFVNPRALSAGAIISLGCDKIFMAEGSRIGSAMPILVGPTGGVQELPPDVAEKMRSNVRAMVRGLAQENGYSVAIAEAMVDPEKGVKIGSRTLNEEGELLNLTAEEAIEIVRPREKPVLAEAIVPDLQALLDHVGMTDREIVRFAETPSEAFARYITTIGPLLLALGLLGVYIEIKSPGFGIPGLVGAILLTLFFFGHFIAGLAGFEDVFLVLIGLGLIAIEVFLIPGFGIPGVLGTLALMAGVVLSLMPHLPDGGPPIPDFQPTAMAEYIQLAMYRFVAAVAITWAGVWLLSKILPKTSLYSQLVHQSALETGDGAAPEESETRNSWVGSEGEALTALHPSGIANIAGERMNVVTSGDLLDKGARVRVVEVRGNRVVVESVP